MLIKAVQAGGGAAQLPHNPPMRILEPWCYNGTRDNKDLENFLFDMEQYFFVTRMDLEDIKVTIAA